MDKGLRGKTHKDQDHKVFPQEGVQDSVLIYQPCADKMLSLLLLLLTAQLTLPFLGIAENR